MSFLKTCILCVIAFFSIAEAVAKEHHTVGKMQEVYTFHPSDVIHKTSAKVLSVYGAPGKHILEFCQKNKSSMFRQSRRPTSWRQRTSRCKSQATKGWKNEALFWVKLGSTGESDIEDLDPETPYRLSIYFQISTYSNYPPYLEAGMVELFVECHKTGSFLAKEIISTQELANPFVEKQQVGYKK